jgi:hypothetical protein
VDVKDSTFLCPACKLTATSRYKRGVAIICASGTGMRQRRSCRSYSKQRLTFHWRQIKVRDSMLRHPSLTVCSKIATRSSSGRAEDIVVVRKQGVAAAVTFHRHASRSTRKLALVLSSFAFPWTSLSPQFYGSALEEFNTKAAVLCKPLRRATDEGRTCHEIRTTNAHANADEEVRRGDSSTLKGAGATLA